MSDKATEYGLRLYNGNSPVVPIRERIRRVHKGLEGQGMSLKDCASLKREKEIACLQVALGAYQKAAGKPLGERVESVRLALEGTGLVLSDVLRASRAYWSLATRKARFSRLHS